MDTYAEIRPPPEFEHLFPVIGIPKNRNYQVQINEDCGLEYSNINEDDEDREKIIMDREILRNAIKIMNEMNESISNDSTSDSMTDEYFEELSNDWIENIESMKGTRRMIPKSEKVKWSEDLNRRKIFVGNVPFNCTQEDFESCFTNIPGIHKADIVKGYRDDSRGIGFVTMNSIADAEDLKSRNDIKCKGRILRFYPYQNSTVKNTLDSTNNYIHIDGIPDGKDRHWLKEIFSEYEPFHRFFIAIDHNTGKRKNTGFLDIVDDHKYDRLISSKFHAVVLDNEKYRAIPVSDSKGRPKRVKDQKLKVTDDTVILTTTRYKQKTLIKNKYRKSTKKDQLLSAMIIEEHKGHARERSGKRFRR